MMCDVLNRYEVCRLSKLADDRADTNVAQVL
jgi:hypothetical protein